MPISTTRRLVGVTAAAGLLLALAGCGSAPTTSASTSGPTAVAGFKPCLVSDNGGFHDHSFNESAKNGMDSAAAAVGVKSIDLESKSANDYGPNMDTLVQSGCTLIVSVGFNLSAETVKQAAANPKIQFAIVDDPADPNNTGHPASANIKPLLFDTAQAGYLGGYAAAAWSDAKGVDKVGTFGGMQIPPVTIFMDGFVEGVQKFNSDNGKNVQVFGWDAKTQKGSFTGGFAANDTAKQTAQGILDQGVDVILPVGGPIYLSAAAAIKDSGKDIVMLGVDSDLAVADPTVKDLLLTSVMKRVDNAVEGTVLAAAKGNLDMTTYVGTLKNEGVGLAPFHDFTSKLPSGLQAKLKALQAQIESGAITVTSPSTPK